MARIDKLKRAVGTATKRTEPSRPAQILTGKGLVKGRVLDYGCGFGFDADHFGWEGYDPYYRPLEPSSKYDTILCTLVLNVLSRNNRVKVIEGIRVLLAEEGRAYLAVARNIPVAGKLGIHHSLQNYVVMTLPSVYADPDVEIYELSKNSQFVDKTQDFMSRRDKRQQR